MAGAGSAANFAFLQNVTTPLQDAEMQKTLCPESSLFLNEEVSNLKDLPLHIVYTLFPAWHNKINPQDSFFLPFPSVDYAD